MDFLVPFGQQPKYFRQWVAAKSCREQWLDKEHSCQSIRIQQVDLKRQAVVSARSRTIDVLSECTRKALIQLLPSVAPDFDIDGEENIQHAPSSLLLRR